MGRTSGSGWGRSIVRWIMRPLADARTEALDWLKTFEAACRGRDFAAGPRLFAPDAVAFGTHAPPVHGLDNIEREPWRQSWPRVRGFRVEGHPTAGGDGAAAWMAAAGALSAAWGTPQAPGT